jgi:glycerol transport system permease protein
MKKTVNQKAWLFVLPVFLLVAFNAIVPLMTVVNYSVQETFGDNVFTWAGTRWFEELLHDSRFHEALKRQIWFTGLVLAFEIPLGLLIALCMPRKGIWVPICLILMALPLLIPWNVVGAIWNIFALPNVGLLWKLLSEAGLFLKSVWPSLGFEYNYTRQPGAAWFTMVLMDVRSRLDPRRLLSGRES